MVPLVESLNASSIEDQVEVLAVANEEEVLALTKPRLQKGGVVGV